MARKYKQGIFRPKNSDKCTSEVCIFRSSLELTFMRFCDNSPNIISWGSEDIIVPYYNPFDKKNHRYFPDNNIVVKEKNGQLTKYLVEIKPEKQTKVPIPGRKKAKTLLKEQYTYAINQCKWESAKKWCDKNGYKFIIITEKELKSKYNSK